MKQWTEQTVVANVRKLVMDMTGEDILADTEASYMTLGTFVKMAQDHAFRKAMVQIEGQTVIVPDEKGNVKIGVVKGADKRETKVADFEA